ncbi:MAG TPA: erythromycin esterase family protein [Gemmatimonadaceae bacterium]|nr:erythromycin esterase family protein [Gemmatimonadaceae bacterium]
MHISSTRTASALLAACHVVIGLLAGSAPAMSQPRTVAPVVLSARSAVDSALAPSVAHDYTLRLPRGGSALLLVRQMGIDVVVEVRDPGGRLIDAVDSPTGRTGEERVEVVAEERGYFAIRVRPFAPNEPAGRYRLTVAEWRDARATGRLLAQRARVRDSGAAWLRDRAAPLRLDQLDAVRELASAVEGARVVGLGEATHGSRELADLRLAVTKHLVRRHGFRMITVEYSATKMGILNQWVLGLPTDEAEVRRVLESGWIGRRAIRELTQWVRRWNVEHPGDPVRLVGVDAHDHAEARARVREILARGFGQAVVAKFDTAAADIARADSQASVFANSSVGVETHRMLVELVARLDADAPLLARLLGDTTVEAARDAARTLMQFADFNAGASDSRSRDWYMAVNLLRALDHAPPGTRAVYWAHNAHVAIAPSRSPRSRTTGGLLREALGCAYRALGASFGSGGFVAQRFGDPSHRLEISTLPQAPVESIDGVMAQLFGGAALATWQCNMDHQQAPGWLRPPRPLHWVGGVFDPSGPPSSAFQPFELLRDFDGMFYLPRVTADEMPDHR